MRVAHVVAQFHPGMGSIETFVLNLASQQRLAGVNAEVVTLNALFSNPTVKLPAYDCVQGIPVRRTSYVGSSIYPLAKDILCCIEPFDIVHVHGAGFFCDYLALTKIVHRKPLVISTHASVEERWARLACLKRHTVTRLALRRYARVFASSPEEKALLPLLIDRKLLCIGDGVDELLAVSTVLAATYSWPSLARHYMQEYEGVLGSRERKILGVAVRSFTRNQAIANIDRALQSGKRLYVCFANAHSLNIGSTNESFRKVLQRFLVLNDGLGLDIASKIKFGKPFTANLNGTDFVPDFLAKTRHKLRIYLVGTTDAVVAQAAQKLQARYPRHSIVGWRSGFFTGQDDIKETCLRVRDAQADCVLVGMGNPLQEFWIADYGAETRARLLFGVGALFDFEAERVQRAPIWVRNLRCEWIYRLLQEPNRLVRRYLVGNLVFLSKVIIDARK